MTCVYIYIYMYIYIHMTLTEMCFPFLVGLQLSILIDLFQKKGFGTKFIHLEAHLEKVPVIEGNGITNK